jgi:uncharacterized lipoprotein YbaY
MPSEKLAIVKGEIVFDNSLNFSPKSTIYVRLEDVTMIDSHSEVISEQIIRGANHQDNSNSKINFEIQGMICDKHSYIVSVHADLDGDGNISKGDFINMQSYPVLTHGYPNYVSVSVKEIN